MELTLSHIPKITPNNPVPWGGETEILFQSFQAENFRPKYCWAFLCAFDLLTLNLRVRTISMTGFSDLHN